VNRIPKYQYQTNKTKQAKSSWQTRGDNDLQDYSKLLHWNRQELVAFYCHNLFVPSSNQTPPALAAPLQCSVSRKVSAIKRRLDQQTEDSNKQKSI